MHAFWFSLLYLFTVYFLAIYHQGSNPFIILLSGVFFTLYFLLPLLNAKVYLFSLYVLTGLIIIIFWSANFNGFVVLTLFIIAKQAIDTLAGRKLYLLLSVQYLSVMLSYLFTNDGQSAMYFSLLSIFIGFLLYSWYTTKHSHRSIQYDYDQIYNEYRQLKRQVFNNAKVARQEERNQIAREIHDSVGHRLTALLMQLEVARLHANENKEKQKMVQLKGLAQASLDETREAVKALKSEDIVGLSAIIQLIRQLESESHIRVSFTLQPGVLSLVLSNKQSVVVYRAVQEALTNMMRHSGAREAFVEFSIVAERYFRFQISHQHQKKMEIKEGFGLHAMRERLEQLQGSLTIAQADNTFRLTGLFPLE
ncbi:sensor histidine kinase [Amphibacillus cookii]|uniref:sensor histidine kinase n=1 Tax=Amphibacillus cookii TaxID=767787 RepID=UPI00195EF3DF|nr:sensor histidine kinase [Amphibacillus cookii]MBM7543095.1 signal transduction histidine kinase [Amphibacillus cookii]